MEQKLSIIIPIYNVEQYLRQCLDSIVNQTYKNIEIILIDDGSPDNCGRICDEYAVRDSRIKVLHKRNEGLSAARNDGIAMATGQWVTFVDSDDWCELNYYEQLFQQMSEIRADILVAGGYIREYEDKDPVFISNFDKTIIAYGREEIEPLKIKVLVRDSTIGNKRLSIGAPWDKLYQTEFIKENLLRFDVSCKAMEDVWFNFQAFDKAESIVVIPVIGYHYRKNAMSITKGYNPEKPQYIYQLIETINEYNEENPQGEKTNAIIEMLPLYMIPASLRCFFFHPANNLSHKQVKEQLNNMKMWPYYQKAIYDKSSRGLPSKQIVLKYLLRLPIVWPLRVAYKVRRAVAD